MGVITEAAVLDALRTVRDPIVDRDVVAAKYVKDLKIDGGRVAFTLEQAIYGASTRKRVGEDAGAAVSRVSGVSSATGTGRSRRARVRSALPRHADGTRRDGLSTPGRAQRRTRTQAGGLVELRRPQ